MPKRPKTPPPADDEPRHLVVYYPYPLHANMELESDRIAFTYWIVSCIGKHNLLALFHKPKSPHMVIIEVRRDYGGFSGLLGEHRWAEFLRKPLEEEKRVVSQVFYCKYSSAREVEKKGWKRVDVVPSWFQLTKEGKPRWVEVNVIVAHPYPRTYLCEVPAEDQTREVLCRPLPVAVFPRPKPPPAAEREPPVGSPEWSNFRQTASSTKPRKAANAAATGPRGNQAYDGSGVSLGVSDISAWGRGPANSPSGVAPLANSPVLNTPSPSSVSSGSSSPWLQGPPGLVHSGSDLSSQPSGSLSDVEGDGEEPFPMQGMPNPAFANAHGDDNELKRHLTYEDGEEGEDEDDDEMFPVNVGQVQVQPMEAMAPENPAVQEPVENLWAGYETTAKVKAEDEWICPVHDKPCKPGICKAAGQRARDKKREEEREKRRAEQEEAKKKKAARLQIDDDDDDDEDEDEYSRRVIRKKKPAPAPVQPQNIPAKPAHLLKKINTEGASGPSAVPPMPAHLAKRTEAAPAGATAPSPGSPAAAQAVPPKPARLSKNDTTKPTASPQTVPSMPARLTKGGAKQAKGKTAGGVPDNTKAVNSAGGWGDIDVRPRTRPGDAASVSSARTWGAISEGPWGNVPNSAERVQPDDAASVSTARTWGAISQGPWRNVPNSAERDQDDDTVSVSTVRTWGMVSEGPWRDVPRGTGQDLPDDVRSVASSRWGNVSEGPWGSVTVSPSGNASNGGAASQLQNASRIGRGNAQQPPVNGQLESKGKGKGKNKGKGKAKAKTTNSPPAGEFQTTTLNWADEVDAEEARAAAGTEQ
ncbi:hypothetical protein WOLCODRAFT_140021 [Wolfiporia cocos MD-104 SS10]|uniref:Uncharacterized protein n=1 Tax=Wolfiporia cocos (strain MD-104) TaxID=742152 RepID=A0A2H3JAB0_WOLCO|nr:hypothetical protein WOLCODRAFT_140021 [Wolfiporia cocos MD-104 SS10]